MRSSTYGEIIKEKKEIQKTRQSGPIMNLKQEVKHVNRTNAKLLRQTTDMNKSIIVPGKKGGRYKKRITR